MSGWACRIAFAWLCLGMGSQAASPPQGQDPWFVPLGGNVYRTDAGGSLGRELRQGKLSWEETNAVYSVFLHVDRPCQLQLVLMGEAMPGKIQLTATLQNQTWEVELASGATELELGTHDIEKAGYVRLDLRGVSKPEQYFGRWSDLRVTSSTPGLKVDFVRNNEGNMFYWGRRGPSVHLRYRVPKDVDLEYAYSQITVPIGQDPLGSYYMANGFGEGYFGIQVNSPTERRVLFSVWSPFQTDNPREIPEAQRIRVLARGPDVKIGEFGNEGSGGQSYLIYPWKAGRTYRFLTRVEPDGQGNTQYTAWFGDKERDEWRLIASFLRPQTDTHLRGFHSFLESFNPAFGFQHREAKHHNVWVRSIEGQWLRCDAATFSVDPTGGGRHRLDFGGGVREDGWYMENCGFFSGRQRAGETFEPSGTSLPTTPPMGGLERIQQLYEAGKEAVSKSGR